MTHERVEQLMLDADDRLNEGKFSAAVEIYNKVLELEPMQDSAYAMLGALHGDQGDIPMAVKSLQKANAWLSLAIIQEKTGDESQALTSFQNAAQHAPDDSIIHFMRGNLQYKKGLTQEALNSYLETVRYDPKNTEAISMAALIFSDMGDYNNAAKGYQAVADLEPDNPDARQRLAGG